MCKGCCCRDAVLRLKDSDLSLVERLDWSAADETRALCQMKGRSEVSPLIITLSVDCGGGGGRARSIGATGDGSPWLVGSMMTADLIAGRLSQLCSDDRSVRGQVAPVRYERLLTGLHVAQGQFMVKDLVYGGG